MAFRSNASATIPATNPLRPLFWRKAQNRLVQTISVIALILAIGAMLWILGTIFSRGGDALSWAFLTNPSKPYGLPNNGIANALLGTLMITTTASAIAIPIALAAGIGLSEFGKQSRFANLMRFCINVMMGVPSILIGLFVYILWVVPQKSFSGFAGAIALAILMIPVITRTTEDMLRMVSDHLREAALALGCSRYQMIVQIVCKSARNGLVSGILLAVARVAGETAPLLFTALFANTWPREFFSNPTANIPVLITESTTNSPFEAMHQIGWGAALVIALIVLLINIVAKTCFREPKK